MVNLNITKSANVSYLFLGCHNKIKYTIIISNTGTTNAECVIVKDLLENGLSITRNSIMVNGCCERLLPDCSINIGAIVPNGNSIITYEVEIPRNYAANEVVNKAVVTYCEGSCTSDCIKQTVESDVIRVPVINIVVKMKKMVDAQCIRVGQDLNYTILIRNESLNNIDNVVLNDIISPELEIYPESVMINSIIQYREDLQNVPIGTINSMSGVIIQFKAKVTTIPNDGYIKNSSQITFSYSINVGDVIFNSVGEVCSNETLVKVNGADNCNFC